MGRKGEEKAIVEFVRKGIKESKSGLLYICGHPGQGKTALTD